MNQKSLTILLVVGLLLVLAAIVLAITILPDDFSPFAAPSPTPRPIPTLNIPPPASLADLAEQYPELATVLNDPELDSVYKQFLVAYQEGGEEAAMQLAQDRGLLTPDGDIRVNLVLDTEDHTRLVEQLEAIGVVVVSAYRDRVNVSVPIDLVRAQLETEDPGAIFEQLSELDHVIAVRLPEQRVPDGSNVDGEGVRTIGADAWHQAGFTGAGLRVGILDLGFSGYEGLLGVELPDQVTMREFGWVEDTVHGTACAEIIHELAPDAELFFAWYDGTDAAMGEAVDWLLNQGVHIISHSAGGFIGPRDGSEWDAQKVDEVARRGVVWVNAAGNEGSSHYRAPFTDQDGDGYHEFLPGEEIMPVTNYGILRVYLMWDDWTQVTQDYDLLLFDGAILSNPAADPIASSSDIQSGGAGQWPAEVVGVQSSESTLYVAVQAYQVSRAGTLDIFVYPSDLDYQYLEPSYSICPPSDAVGSLTVGAANYWDDSLAYYSSQGPSSDGRLKPEISAPTAVTGASYGDSIEGDPDEGFNGTSAACPHVAGAAALVWQAFPNFGRQDVVDYLLNNAVDRGVSGPDTGFGFGRLALPVPPAASQPPPTSEPPPSPAPTEAGTGVAPTAAPPPTTAPLPVPTSVPYVTPVPQPRLPGGGTTVALGLILLTGGVGCLGALLLLLGGIGLLIIGRRSRAQRARSRRPARGRPPAPPQAARCQTCGAVLQPGSRFCNNCGRPVS